MASTGEIRNAELVLRRKDGRKIVVLENSRAVRDEHGRDPLLRRHADRHHRGARAVAAAVVRSEPRRAVRPDQPSRVRDPPAARARLGAGDRRAARGVLSRSRSVQGHQRHVRPRRGRRAAATAGTAPAEPRAQQRRARATRRRRVRAAAARLLDRRMRSSIANALLKAVEQYQFVWGASTFTVGASIGLVPLERRLPADHASAASRRRRVLRGQGPGPQSRARLPGRRCDRRAAPRRDAMGSPRQARAERESLPARSATDRTDPGHRRRAARARARTSCCCACATKTAASCRPAHSCRRSSATTCRSGVDRWVISTALHWLAANPGVDRSASHACT